MSFDNSWIIIVGWCLENYGFVIGVNFLFVVFF